jgi:Icc-related predicted phosphoesterase
MTIVALTDLHGKTDIIPLFGTVLNSADLIVLAGDNTHFGHHSQMQDVIQAVRRFNNTIIAVSGNCDYPDAEQYLVESGIGINGRYQELQGMFFAGLSGSLPCPGTTPHEFSEDEYQTSLESLARDIHHPFILVTHQPPHGTKNDRVFLGFHVGSKTIRKFIEEFSPLVCFTGHIHEGSGIDTIHQTRIINPGPARDGNYASLIVENGVIRDLRIAHI